MFAHPAQSPKSTVEGANTPVCGARERQELDARAARIKASLLTAGDVIPDTLRHVVYGQDRAPTIVIPAADGVCTFAGFDDDEPVKARMRRRLAELHEQARGG